MMSSISKIVIGVLATAAVFLGLSLSILDVSPASAAASTTCELQVPADPTSPAGLATPYVLAGRGCHESDPDYSAFVQAAVISADGSVSVYSPLVIDRGTRAAVQPVAPSIAPGSVVGIWFGFDAIDLHLTGAGAADCSNGLNGSDFGQFASCNAANWFSAAHASIQAGQLAVPALGTDHNGATCPSVASFDIVDQDPADNVQTTYLVNAKTRRVAQNTAATHYLLRRGYSVLSNPSDNALLTNYVDPAIGCTPWTAPDLADPGHSVAALALDQLQANLDQQAPVADVQLSDEMTLIADRPSLAKTALYRSEVDESPSIPSSNTYWCSNLLAEAPKFLLAHRRAFVATASPDPANGANLYAFLVSRFAGTYAQSLPVPGVVPSCQQVLHRRDPLPAAP
jgi:hypothetical protein